jgi:2-succinyl-5-enolpyruvyl-6-hydroxy-3-cyclohexene-1-carboxylate synthase
LLNNSIQKTENNYEQLWQNKSHQITEPAANTDFSDIYATGNFLKHLPEGAQLILANSSALRNAQLFPLDKTVEVYCNRGVNGIEGSMAAAVGFASVCAQPVYLLIGDLSFFYGLNALWNIQHIRNLHILLINNNGGSIFHTLPGLNRSESLNCVAAAHQTNAKAWVEAAGLQYLQADSKLSFDKNLDIFMNEKTQQSVLMEVLVDIDVCKLALEKYYIQ